MTLIGFTPGALPNETLTLPPFGASGIAATHDHRELCGRLVPVKQIEDELSPACRPHLFDFGVEMA